MKNAPLKMSTAVLGSQRQPVKGHEETALVDRGWELMPSMPRVFSANQHIYLCYEVYDPAREEGNEAAGTRHDKANSGVRLLSSVAFLQRKNKAYDTPLLNTQQL